MTRPLSIPAARDAYRAHRSAWRAEVGQWLATRELPGPPAPIEPPDVLSPLVVRDPLLGPARLS